MVWGALIAAGVSLIASNNSRRDANRAADQQNQVTQQAIGEIQQIANEAQALEQQFLAAGNAEAAANIREATAARIAAYGQVLDEIPGLKQEIALIAQTFYDEAEQLYAPFRADKTAANNAFNQQLAMLGLPNIDGSANAFDPDSITSRPSYQFVEEQGNRGVDRSAAARTGSLGGRAVKEAARFNSGLASQEFNNEFNRLGSVGNALNQSAQFGVTGTANALTNSTGIISNGYARLNDQLLNAIIGQGEAEAGGFEALGALALDNAGNLIQLSQNNTNTQASLLGSSATSQNDRTTARQISNNNFNTQVATSAGQIANAFQNANDRPGTTSTGGGQSVPKTKKRTANIFG